MNKYTPLKDGTGIMISCVYPNICPICNNSISPNEKYSFINKTINIVSFLFECPACGKGFVSHYSFNKDKTETFAQKSWFVLDYIGSYPKIPERYDFDNCIEKLSPDFCIIYNQALSSETYELNQLSGIGYRKALEFLIKDYCIYKLPEKVDDIKSKQLGQVINTYIDSDKIKNLAKASAWIGNDETHYVRKFEDKDINDLKRFIKSTVAFITYELTSDEAEELVES